MTAIPNGTSDAFAQLIRSRSFRRNDRSVLARDESPLDPRNRPAPCGPQAVQSLPRRQVPQLRATRRLKSRLTARTTICRRFGSVSKRCPGPSFAAPANGRRRHNHTQVSFLGWPLTPIVGRRGKLTQSLNIRRVNVFDRLSQKRPEKKARAEPHRARASSAADRHPKRPSCGHPAGAKCANATNCRRDLQFTNCKR